MFCPGMVHDSLYASLHAAYNVPYQSSDTRCVNSGLVLDLARALRDDINSGIPVNFLKHMTPNAVKVFLWQSGQGKKR